MTPEGGKCHVVDKTVPIFGDFYVGSTCPCEEGLVCVQQGEKKNNGICQIPPTTAAPTEAPVDDGSDSGTSDEANDSGASDGASDSGASDGASDSGASDDAAPAEAEAAAAPEAAPAEE
ncbi:probable GH family 25 lysozyme 3 [Parasteatoda tepidariorum]|uniref:probable GH family 25 lysozyme 3 n=1 Tax=Parasteatoda tepidariorum TaxID=114398 RepID=UPI0039BC6902